MRAFISHMFTENDTPLATRLADILKARGGSGYLAEKHLEYDLMIHEKLKGAIAGSDYLVAIVTKNGQSSPSVHEEIGYALGRGIPVLIMLEQGVELKGVFAHGKEPEEFDRDRFDAHAGNIVDYMERHPTGGRSGDLKGSEAGPFLERRKISDVDSDYFARNEHYSLLYDWTMNDVAKHVIIFTACPRRLRAHADVATAEFEEWATGRRDAGVPTIAIPVQRQDPERDMDSLTFYDTKPDVPEEQNVKSYCEFRNNGYFEAGTASKYTYREGGDRVLHLGWMIGGYLGFLNEVKGFYEKIGFDGPFDTFLSISNSAGLVLGNFGNEACGQDYQGSPQQKEMLAMFKRIKRKNLQVTHGFSNVQDLTEARMRIAAHDAATKVAHAYGQKEAKCFDADGRFAWELYGTIERGPP